MLACTQKFSTVLGQLHRERSEETAVKLEMRKEEALRKMNREKERGAREGKMREGGGKRNIGHC